MKLKNILATGLAVGGLWGLYWSVNRVRDIRSEPLPYLVKEEDISRVVELNDKMKYSTIPLSEVASTYHLNRYNLLKRERDSLILLEGFNETERELKIRNGRIIIPALISYASLLSMLGGAGALVKSVLERDNSSKPKSGA